MDKRLIADTDISTHALRMEGDGIFCRIAEISLISTHALRMEGDLPPGATAGGF